MQALGKLLETKNSIWGKGYYAEMAVIGSHKALRRLWINEGKRRGWTF